MSTERKRSITPLVKMPAGILKTPVKRRKSKAAKTKWSQKFSKTIQVNTVDKNYFQHVMIPYSETRRPKVSARKVKKSLSEKCLHTATGLVERSFQRIE